MAGNQGRGKESFRQFKRTIAEAYRDLIEAIEDGEEFYSDYIEDIFNQVYLAYVEDLVNLDIPNKELWQERASQEVTKRITQVYDKYGEPDEEPEEEESENEEFPPPEIGDNFITIRGVDFPIITRQEAPTMRRAGRTPRNRIFTTLEDVEEYIFAEDWPYEYIVQYGGIEIIYRGSAIVGFRIWIG